MSERAIDWLEYTWEDLAVAKELVDGHGSISAYHAHQAAEKGLKALQIHRDGDHDRTHDLVRLFRTLGVPTEFRSVLEDLNPADTAARYPDADEINLDRPNEAVEEIGDVLEWIKTRLNG